MTERTRIQRDLILRLQQGKYFRVEYDANTDLPLDVDPLAAQITAPDSVKCNEIEGQFIPDPNYGQDRRLKQGTWIFEALLEWSNEEVTLEYLLKSFSDKPPIIARDGDLRQVTLVLLNFIVEHPVLQGGSCGTKAKLTFNAELGRN